MTIDTAWLGCTLPTVAQCCPCHYLCASVGASAGCGAGVQVGAMAGTLARGMRSLNSVGELRLMAGLPTGVVGLLADAIPC